MTSNAPLGTSGDLRRRFLLHHVPLALASAGVLVLFMSLPLFDANRYPHADIFSGPFPQERAADHAGPIDHAGRHTGQMDHGGGHAPSRAPSREQMRHRSFERRFTLATGYVTLGLLAFTLLIGPTNLMLRRRNPVSSHLRRDVGMWTAIGSIVHVIVGLQVHGGGQISDFLDYFVTRDGSPRLNSFGLGNWTGLVALVIVVGLLAISSDAALRKLKARPWKRVQRLNYALFALVILHAFFYGALLRVTSPFTLMLGVSVIAVFAAQTAGIWLWRRRRHESP
jgi:sulfoxide reductase heme-binding subunit YedZ